MTSDDIPDALGSARWKHLATPDKLAYARGKRPQVECLLCAVLAKDPAVERLEIFRTERWAVSANLYPYNPGHVFLFPLRHLVDVRELLRAEERELAKLQRCTLDILEDIYHPQGFNVGFNLGRCAGASIRHLHLHVVPRYEGEMGFLEMLTQTRTVVEDPRRTVRRLRARYRKVWKP